MNKNILKILRALVEQYSTDLCDDPKRCRALLMDLCGDYVKEIRVLCMAVEIKLPHELLSTSNTPFEIQRLRLAQKLTDEYAMAEDAALWCIDTWAFALGMEDNLKHNTGLKANKPDNEGKKAKRQISSNKGASAIKKPGPLLVSLDADYYINYETGIIPIGDLPIGTRVVDPSWQWEFRTSDNYTGSGVVKPVTWIVVAKDHYELSVSHVTLFSEELIGKHPFIVSNNRSNQCGINHWGESSAINCKQGLRPWLNSAGIHSDKGFYQAFSEMFKASLLETTLPNKEWSNGNAYITNDHIFIPSTTELGDINHDNTYQIGSSYAYLLRESKSKRKTRINVEYGWYWTRSPASYHSHFVQIVNLAGGLGAQDVALFNIGVRPVLNLKSDILASVIKE